METKHTPGPWKVTVNGINSPDGHIVFFDKSGGPHETDARLIEAAPELLHNLMVATNYLERVDGDNEHTKRQVGHLRKLIAKATGTHQSA